MNSTTERLLETLVSQHDQVFRDYFVALDELSPESEEYKACAKAFDDSIAETVRACGLAELAEVIATAPAGSYVDACLGSSIVFETDAPGLDFLREAARQVFTAHLFIRYTGSL